MILYCSNKDVNQQGTALNLTEIMQEHNFAGSTGPETITIELLTKSRPLDPKFVSCILEYYQLPPLFCSECEETTGDFTKTQRSKPRAKRRCVPCTNQPRPAKKKWLARNQTLSCWNEEDVTKRLLLLIYGKNAKRRKELGTLGNRFLQDWQLKF